MWIGQPCFDKQSNKEFHTRAQVLKNVLKTDESNAITKKSLSTRKYGTY